MSKKMIAALSMALLVSASSYALADDVKIPENQEPEKAEASEQQGPVYYKIVPHDTLWDISRKFLKNPFKWPTIWKVNPYIKNPDLIYPGNVVRITPDGIEIIDKKEAELEQLPVITLEPQAEKVIVLEPEGDAAGEKKTESEAQAPVSTAKPAPKIKSDSIPRRGFISKQELESAGAVAAIKEENTLNAIKGDVVYLSFKTRPNVGERYMIFQEDGTVKHPATKKVFGSVIDVIGSLAVTKAEGTVEGIIDTSYKEIQAGARLKAYREPVTEVELTDSEKDVDGYVVVGAEGFENLVKGDIAYIDKGEKDGIKNGNIMRAYRPSDSTADPLDEEKEVAIPPIELGTLVVVEAGDSTSSCVVIKSLRPINWGDRVSTARSN
ncbi:MAG: LysM peptidoglycan-binding domain-containing protein [Deltaproteobacteria bacterium]|nr:LysM peptidoglycan-binding domain-containing protein [Deltaproteobacteria bacterium]